MCFFCFKERRKKLKRRKPKLSKQQPEKEVQQLQELKVIQPKPTKKINKIAKKSTKKTNQHSKKETIHEARRSKHIDIFDIVFYIIGLISEIGIGVVAISITFYLAHQSSFPSNILNNIFQWLIALALYISSIGLNYLINKELFSSIKTKKY